MVELHKEFSYPRMTNCWIFAVCMCFDKRIKRLLIRLNHFTVHFLVVTKSDNVLHLTSTQKKMLCHPLRFEGEPSIFPLKYLRKNKYISIRIR